MEQTVKLIMSQILGIEPDMIVDDTSPKNISEWDSLKHMELIMALEEEFQIEFSDEKIDQITSYKAIILALKELIM
ncbi:MAG: acyl carrier protein [Syntrophomonas sp.]